MLAVVAELEDSPPIKMVGAVLSWAWHDQPFEAVSPVAPLIVITTVQEFAPRVRMPAAAPPVVEDTEHPEVVNFVPIAASGAHFKLPAVQTRVAATLFSLSTPSPTESEPKTAVLAAGGMGEELAGKACPWHPEQVDTVIPESTPLPALSPWIMLVVWAIVAAPGGVAHVPSPRQKVLEDAAVPEFKLAGGRLPTTPVERGRPVAFVRTPEAGVPSAGVVIVGEFRVGDVRVNPAMVDAVAPRLTEVLPIVREE